MNIEESQIVNSALWAAYGDALGFITELADNKILQARAGTETITGLIPWQRKIGGKFGAIISLPTGAYSDDTQLRLATARAIKSNGHFAIHAFSKIELPAWQNYALGAGQGSKLAAAMLAKNNTVWFNNFFKNEYSDYTNGGGNGAAMRIQPHVWSTADLNNHDKYILEVIKNSITTHGHPRAIAGAVFHALSLAWTLVNGRLPNIDELRMFNDWTLEIPRIIDLDVNLNSVWRTQYENATGITLENAYATVHQEIAALIDQVALWSQISDRSYQTLVTTLDLCDKKTRGSGTLTAVAAAAAAWLINDIPAPMLFQQVVNALGTDTDSIATMMGAILGVVLTDRPPESLQDEAYIIGDAQRLYAISQGQPAAEFTYPNAMNRKNPGSLADYVTIMDSCLYMYPFGQLDKIEPSVKTNSGNKTPMYYQWVQAGFGQSLLIKRRDDEAIKTTNTQAVQAISNNKAAPRAVMQQTLPSIEPEPFKPVMDIDELTTMAIKNNFDRKLIGQHIVELAESQLGCNGVIAYSAIISKAVAARKAKAH